jgi:hypothetical protein
MKNTAARQRAQAKYNSKPEQKKKRAARNKARRTMIREGKARKGDGKDVMHEDGNALNNKRSNWSMGTKKANRSFPRTSSARKKNPKD